jgi:hypothetical protein
MAYGAEASKGSEELIMTTDTGAGHEAAHGEVVDECIVENLVFEGLLGSTVPFSTDRLRRKATSSSGGLEETPCCGTIAETIGDGIADKALGIDRARKMHVEIAALRHIRQESIESQRVLSGNAKCSDRSLFRSRRRGYESRFSDGRSSLGIGYGEE